MSGSANKTGQFLQDRILGAVVLVLLIAGFCASGAAHAANALAAWRSEVAEVQVLAENDAPLAYRQAQHLQQALPADALPADRVRAFNLLARIEIYLALTDRAAEHVRLALDLAGQYGDTVGQAQAELNEALNSVNQGQIGSLIIATAHSVATLEGVDRPDLLAEALLRSSMMYRRIGHIDESVTMALRAMDVARSSKDARAMTYGYQGLAILSEQSGRPEDARKQFLLMRNYARSANSKLLEAYALTGLGRTDDTLGDSGSAGAFMNEAIALFRSVGTPFGINHGMFALAEHSRSQHNYTEAVSLLDAVIATLQKYPNDVGLWQALNARSANYLSLGRRADARSDAEQAYRLARAMGFSVYLSESARRVAAIAAADGDYRNAYQYSVDAADMKAKAARDKAAARMVELAQRYRAESRQHEIEELTRRNEQQTAELQQRELQQRWLWTLLAGSVAVLAVTGFFLMRLRRSHAIIRGLNAGLEERVQARTSELRQQSRYLRTLIDTLPWWVWFKDTASRYLAVNQTAAESCGLKAEELVGKSDFELRPHALAEAFRADDIEVMSERRRKTVEELQLVGDRAIWMETFKAPVLDEDGTVLGTVGFARDISERKAAEAAREAALVEAQRLARVRSEFLAQMSHELRTPLNGILGYAQILRRDKNLDERQRAGLRVIEQSGGHLLTLINDILDLAKIEAGRLDLSPGNVQLPRFLNTIAEMIRVRTEQKDLDFVCDFAPDLPALIQADEKRLCQVLLNLLSNAVKFTDSGQVRLGVCVLPEGKLRFEVQDSGIGIGAEQLEAVFQPFEQAGDARHRGGGTGLGLAITRQLVRLMGGDIHVDSQLGGGSKFWFELALPVVSGEPADAGFDREVIGYDGPRKTILVVDDVAENRAMAADMLSRLGFSVQQAADGAAALEKARLLCPDLILMDIVMPGMDGLEVARRLRQLPACAAVPIIAVSASASDKDRERYLAAGLDAFLPKPIDYDMLLIQIAAHLELSWTYEVRPVEPLPEKGNVRPVMPSEQEMEVLYGLARMGNMQDILEWAGRLVELDPRYHPFAEQLSALARTYQSKAILNLAKRYLESKEPS